MSLIDLNLRRWYHCTATQTAATTKAQFWNKPIVRGEGRKDSQEGKTEDGRGDKNEPQPIYDSKAPISAAYWLPKLQVKKKNEEGHRGEKDMT